jgi:diguanylate cyclase (GGDEF)-like protein
LGNSVLFERTHQLATRDPLTGLLNRRAFGERMVDVLASNAKRGHTVTYAIIDVDDFKAINDTYGHGHGDSVLQHVATTLCRAARTGDLIGRYAGDEFVVLLAHADAALGRALVARISADLRTAGLRCSIGAARFPHDGDRTTVLFAAADRALYVTKAAGKNGYSFA